MPELPEVEVTRLSLADRIAGATIESVRLGKPLRWPLGVPAMQLVGRKVRAIRRRGKYLLLDLDEGLLLLHLGMSGSLSFAPQQPPHGAHDHFDLGTSRGVLRLNDPRRFGAVVYARAEDSAQATKLLGGLGVEPLTEMFDLDTFHAGLKRRHAPVKQVLLAGDLVVGVGNIYASEALFLAGIRPTLRASRISRPRAEKLRLAVRDLFVRRPLFTRRWAHCARNTQAIVIERIEMQFKTALAQVALGVVALAFAGAVRAQMAPVAIPPPGAMHLDLLPADQGDDAGLGLEASLALILAV